MKYLLDTNTLIHFRGERSQSVLARFERLTPGEAVMSVISYGELVFGAEKSARRAALLGALAELATMIPVLDLTPAAAQAYGSIRRDLERDGRMIGGNDLWIAAQALAAHLVVVTSNEREFERVQGLVVENWVG